MKILVLGSRVPFPLNDGGAIATYQFLKELSPYHQITYFTFNTKKHFVNNTVIKQNFSFCTVICSSINANVHPLKAIWALLRGKNYNISRFNKPQANSTLKHLLTTQNWDVVHFESLYTSTFLPTVKAHFKGPTILRTHNIEHQIWQKLGLTKTGLKKWYINLLSNQLKKYEKQTIPLFTHCIGISPQDTNWLLKYNPNSSTIGVGQKTIMAIPKLNPNCFFHLGSMEWQPNIQGVMWFLKTVWPTIYAEFPKATFHIAGKGLQTTNSIFNIPGVVNHGMVESATDFMQKHGCSIIPLQSASGVRIKALEAMALGIPVISTEVGLSGIPTHLGITANTSLEMIEAMRYCLQNPTFTEQKGITGYQYIKTHFSIENLVTNWNNVYTKLLNT